MHSWLLCVGCSNTQTGALAALLYCGWQGEAKVLIGKCCQQLAYKVLWCISYRGSNCWQVVKVVLQIMQRQPLLPGIQQVIRGSVLQLKHVLQKLTTDVLQQLELMC